MSAARVTDPPLQQTRQTSVQSIRHPDALREAAMLAAAGRATGIFNRSVCAIMGDGGNPAFVEEIVRIKGERRRNRPMAVFLSTAELVPLIDPDEVAPALRPIMLDPAELQARLAALCFVRVPVREEAARAIPPALLSRSARGVPILMNFDALGQDSTGELVRAFRHQGIAFPAGTSMNRSGQPEIVRQDEGIAFARDRGIPLFLEDPGDPGGLTGSGTILLVDRDGVRLIRDGYIPAGLFELLLAQRIDATDARPAHFDQWEPELPGARELSPRALRTAILAGLDAAGRGSRR